MRTCGQEHPAVLVVIPAFNRPHRLAEAVRSVLSQDYVGALNLVVVDDASTEPLHECRDLVVGAGHSWISHDGNLGPAAARNTGASSQLDGVWIAFLDSDDLWEADKLSTQIMWHLDNPEFRISQVVEQWYRKGRVIAKPGHLAQPETGMIFADCIERCAIGPSCVLICRSLFRDSGGFDCFFRVCEDYELWLRLATEQRVGLVNSERPLVTKRAGPDQLSTTVPALDRYRLVALAEFLVSGPKNDEHRQMALSKFRQKAAILAKGAQKRDRTEWVEFFSVLQSVDSAPDAQQIEQAKRYCNA